MVRETEAPVEVSSTREIAAQCAGIVLAGAALHGGPWGGELPAGIVSWVGFVVLSCCAGYLGGFVERVRGVSLPADPRERAEEINAMLFSDSSDAWVVANRRRAAAERAAGRVPRLRD